MADKLQVVYNLQGVPHLRHVEQDVTRVGSLVVLVHLGYLKGLLCCVNLVEAQAVHPKVLYLGVDHQSLDVSDLLGVNCHRPVYARDPAVVFVDGLAPGVGDDIEVAHFADEGINDAEYPCIAGQKSQWEAGSHGKARIGSLGTGQSRE